LTSPDLFGATGILTDKPHFSSLLSAHMQTKQIAMLWSSAKAKQREGITQIMGGKKVTGKGLVLAALEALGRLLVTS